MEVVIDCSLWGERKLSPAKAEVVVAKKEDTILNHLINSRRKIDGSICLENEEPDYLLIGKKELNPELFDEFCSALWVAFFKKHYELEDEIRSMGSVVFESSNEMFFNNIHLDIITKYIRIGRYAVVRDYSNLSKILKDNSYKSYKEELLKNKLEISEVEVDKSKIDEFDTTEVRIGEIKGNHLAIENNLNKDEFKVIDSFNKKDENKDFSIGNLDDIDYSKMILVKNDMKPINIERQIRVFKFGAERVKIVETEDDIIAFLRKRTVSGKVDLSIFNKNYIKRHINQLDITKLQSQYKNSLDKNNSSISDKSLRAVVREVYNSLI